MKRYRQDAHVIPLVFWAVLCAAAATIFFVHSGKISNRVLSLEEIVAGVGLLVLGPLALTVYLVRARTVWVGVDPERGIVFRGERLIPWDEIRSVERRRPRLRRESGPAGMPEQGWMRHASGCGDPGCGCVNVSSLGELFAVVGLLLAALVAIWFLFVVVVPLLVVPLLEVFAPFGDRVKIVARGRTLVLRDLREADEFVRLVSARRPVVER
jgi:hypothetical protein